MIWILLWLVFYYRSAPPPGTEAATAPEIGMTRTAFTLIEVLVSIAVIAVLIGILLPALSWARVRGTMTRSQSLARQLVAGVSLYSNDSRDAFPYFGTPGDPWGPMVVRGHDFGPRRTYFRSLSWYWASLVVPEYLSPRAAVEPPWMAQSLRGGGYTEGIVRSSFAMTDTAFAAPEYWRGVNAPEDLSLLRATSCRDVLFPSSKGLLVDLFNGVFSSRGKVGSSSDLGKASVAWADGSGSKRSWPQVPADSEAVARPFGSHGWPIMDTPNGLAGRDARE